MTQPIIVFDLDGTLIDTAPDLLDSLNHALVSGGVPEVDTVTHRA
ncbi:MAG: HAD hydrolase-like protein, partial [Mesorhizobium sp.]|nr:HAD hydrolase-like protein [Mesorhizobium sp.]